MEDCGLCLGKMASFSHRLERKLEITVPPPQPPETWSTFSLASPGGEMGVGKQKAGGDLGLHVLPTSPWEFLKTPFNPAFPKGSLWARNNDGEYREKRVPPLPPTGQGALRREFWPWLPSRPTGLLFSGTPCSSPLAASASLSASPHASQAVGPPRPMASQRPPCQ